MVRSLTLSSSHLLHDHIVGGTTESHSPFTGNTLNFQRVDASQEVAVA